MEERKEKSSSTGWEIPLVYDVFIAYHGTNDRNGTYQWAKRVADYLRERNFTVYLHGHCCLTSQPRHMHLSFTDTYQIVAMSRCFLLLLNDHCPRCDGFLGNEEGKEPGVYLKSEVEQFAYEFMGQKRAQDDFNFCVWEKDRKASDYTNFIGTLARGHNHPLCSKNSKAAILKWLTERKNEWEKRELLDRPTATNATRQKPVFSDNASANGETAEGDLLAEQGHYSDAAVKYAVSAGKGNAAAQLKLARCYLNGVGVMQSDKEAFRWFSFAARKDFVEAQFSLAVCYSNGQGTERDTAKAVQWYRKAAERGHAEAQFNLGVCYDNGEGVEQDSAEAVQWYRKAAEQGNVKAQFNLGVCYDNGEGVERDPAEAVQWYRKAAERGHAVAQNNLGVCYDNGEGVERDPAEAFQWYRKAAEQGNVKAQFNLGVCYDNGEGVERDPAEAVQWYRKAAERGHAVAQFNLGVCYDNGKGVERDPAEAVQWYRKAAERGYAKAQFNLGVSYAKGEGVEQDPAEAFQWYRKAAEQGLAEANDALAALETAPSSSGL